MLGVSPCQFGQELHPTSQNSSIFNLYDPFSGVRDCVIFFCSIPISLEMTAFWNMVDFALKIGPKTSKNITNFNCMIITT